ncbi:uncharacterized protein LOC114249368 [Bombyx mandarina]|uniref:Uncharacterized protein LOC114249368 n=1 Tax=Bombyx mandarina TaxID=7092 RepID=A0A6J2KAM4_BOMMA|nr:uncharacterized protein LOC114249368 [Bombyx mandarina]
MIENIFEMKDMKEKSANDCWDEMANSVRKTTKAVFGESKGKGIIDKDTWWWNENVQRELKEKKNAFKKWQLERGNESEKQARKNEFRECKKKATKAVAIARSDGCKVLMKDDEIKERWKIYFEKLMNEENDWNRVINRKPENVGLVNEISMYEVREAVRSMKSGKSEGPDGIPVEVWKILGEDGYKWLTLFFNKLLQEEVIPTEWSTSTLVPIYKNKGDVQDCGSYRGIKLMSHSMKVLEKVIEKRLRDESEITQNQFGFMPGRGTTDAIFALRQVWENIATCTGICIWCSLIWKKRTTEYLEQFCGGH